jgi:serine/threonine protein kinase
VLYQLMTGRLPFHGEFEEVVQARRYSDPLPPRAFRPDLPPAVDSLVHRMIAREPDGRPAGAAEVEAELRALLLDTRPAGGSALVPAPGGGALVDRIHWGIRWRGRELVRRGRAVADRYPRWMVASVATGALFALGGLLLALC